ncbi:DUF222 domain-containing protein [Myxococcota bacterium]
MDCRDSPPDTHIDRVDTLADEIATLAAHLTTAEYRLLCKIREFDARDGWYHQGARSCAHWLNWRIGLGLVAAREKVRVARALAALPAISAAMAQGALSYSKVRALTRIATPQNEEELLENAHQGTASHVEKMVRLWRRACRAEELGREAMQQAEKYLRVYWDDTGMLVIEGRLPAEEGAVVERALDAARDELFGSSKRRKRGAVVESSGSIASAESSSKESSGINDSAQSSSKRPSGINDSAQSCETDEAVTAPRQRGSWSRQSAEALLQISQAALCARNEDTLARPAQVTVHVDAQVLADVHAEGRCELEDGATIAADTMRRLSCDADVLAVVHGPEGEPPASGRRTRKASGRLRCALWQRDQGCVFPGCACHRFLHAHHVRHWADGGPTHLGNLILLCRFHHRLVHEGGFSVEQTPDGLRFSDPRGEPVAEHQPLPLVYEDPLFVWRLKHRSIDATTTMPDWEGERPDYGEMLRPLFERERGLCA